jgi:hypothetical protein
VNWKANVAEFNGLPAVYHNGGYLDCADNSLTIRTIFVVASYDAPTFGWYNGILGKKKAGSIDMLIGVPDTGKYSASGTIGLNGGGQGAQTPSSNIQVPALLTAVLSTSYTYSTWVGKASTTEHQWYGHIAEIIAYPGVLSAESVAVMECYLGNKYAIALSHTCP